jgi:hypothetical protein
MKFSVNMENIMKKKYFLWIIGGLALTSCDFEQNMSHTDARTNVQASEMVILYDAEKDIQDPQRGLGTLADAQSTESVADQTEQDRIDELLPNRLYADLKGHEGATIATF